MGQTLGIFRSKEMKPNEKNKRSKLKTKNPTSTMIHAEKWLPNFAYLQPDGFHCSTRWWGDNFYFAWVSCKSSLSSSSKGGEADEAWCEELIDDVNCG